MNPQQISVYWRAAGLLGIILIITLSLIPAPPQINIDNGDKLGHLAAYGLVTLWFAHLYTGLRQRIWLAIGMVALGIALEYAQGATGYRTFDVTDMVADALGVAIGWLAASHLPNSLDWAKKRLSD